MKTIGFVDYYISEWHANNYPVWIKKICEEIKEDFVVKYAWAELDVSLVDGKNTDEWCKEFGVEKCQTIQELCEKSDYILVLSPSNPEMHLKYAKEVLKYKKRTYIDKTFAPDCATAKEIFALGEKYGTPFFSSSALRYGEELEAFKGSNAILTLGGGGNMPEYIIHQIEMVIKTINAKALSVRVEKQSEQYVITVKFEDEKRATMVYGPMFGFSIGNNDGFKQVTSPFFMNLLKDILNFYNTGEKSFDGKETLEVMKIREGIIKGKDKLGEWIEL